MPETNAAPAYTYEWFDTEETTLKRTDTDGNVTYVPTDPLNPSYSEFISSGASAASYVEPSRPELTTEQKVDNMLNAFGLTREEMIVALQVKTGKG